MNRRFTLLTLSLVATIALLIGFILAGSLEPDTALSGHAEVAPAAAVSRTIEGPGAVNFADVVEEINPAVVNIDATSRARSVWREHRFSDPRPNPGHFDPPSDLDPPMPRDLPQHGAGSGFIIDREGYILTNNHVVDRAERVSVKLADGRNLRARIVGADPDTDIALVKVEGAGSLPQAPLGDSDTLRVGEWVCAIGNPLAYEHSVTVGVVSYIGRKLFDPSLDDYIQTDAAINFGNSGGPLINARGQVIGINAAISRPATNIGFAVPINQARAILAHLKARGRVSRGYVGVSLKDLDPDLQRLLKLDHREGALVQDVTPGSPAGRAGIRAYDVILEVDDRPVTSNDALIREIASRAPGSVVRLRVVRDAGEQTVSVTLAERPRREEEEDAAVGQSPLEPRRPLPGRIGLAVQSLDRRMGRHLGVPDQVRGVLVLRVEPMSPAYDAGLDRGEVIVEINRRRVASEADYTRLVAAAKPGEPLVMYVYVPRINQHELRVVRIDGP